MRPIHKHDIEVADYWPGVVLTTKTEQLYLNQAVGALSDKDQHERAVKSELTVERFTEPDEYDMQARMNHAWRITGGDDDPAIFPYGRPLDQAHVTMAIDALNRFMTHRTNLDPEAIRTLAADMEDNFAWSQRG